MNIRRIYSIFFKSIFQFKKCRFRTSLRSGTVRGDAREELQGWVELDEGFFEVRIDKKEKRSLKRGRGSQRQATVLVMAESELKSLSSENENPANLDQSLKPIIKTYWNSGQELPKLSRVLKLNISDN